MEKQEKLLLVGGDIATPHVIKYCKKIGVYTIMTNDIPYENNPIKQMADEAWEIPVEELDILEAKCKEVGVTGVFAGVNEHNLDMTQALSKRLGLPFYASDEGWACARDKLRFKEHCIAVGLDVPKQYHIQKPFDAEILANVEYPVIVKPADSSGSRGVAVCYNEEELTSAFDHALSFSESGRVVVEDYIDGNEFIILICLVNGYPIVYDFASSYHVPVNGRKAVSFCTNIVRNWTYWELQNSEKVVQLFDRMNCKEGCLFLQGACRNGRYYLFELGYRLDGLGSWLTQPASIGFNPLELQVDLALGHDQTHHQLPDDCKLRNHIVSIYQIYPRAGIVSKITGLENLLNNKNVKVTINRYHEGDQIQAGHSLFHMAYNMLLSTTSEKETQNLLQFINTNLHFYDEDGNDMLHYFEDYSIFETSVEN